MVDKFLCIIKILLSVVKIIHSFTGTGYMIQDSLTLDWGRRGEEIRRIHMIIIHQSSADQISKTFLKWSVSFFRIFNRNKTMLL